MRDSRSSHGTTISPCYGRIRKYRRYAAVRDGRMCTESRTTVLAKGPNMFAPPPATVAMTPSQSGKVCVPCAQRLRWCKEKAAQTSGGAAKDQVITLCAGLVSFRHREVVRNIQREIERRHVSVKVDLVRSRAQRRHHHIHTIVHCREVAAIFIMAIQWTVRRRSTPADLRAERCF